MAKNEKAEPATKRVRMLTSVAGTPPYHSGDIVDLREDIADAWIAEGYAKLHRGSALEDAETATAR